MGGLPSGHDIFDVRKIRRLVELMKEHDLAEMDLRQADMRIQLRRGEDREPVLVTGSPAPSALPAVADTHKPATGSPAEAAPKEDDKNIVFITSPMIGTYYAASDPDSEPYVKVGDVVGDETTVCIIEAMKVFNEIQSEVSGKIVAALLENGEPVEFGQRLFKVDTRQ